MARPREFDEEQVIQSAQEVFWLKGYQRTSVRDLVDATGLQRGSLYGAFGDKHGLYLASLDAYHQRAMNMLEQHVVQAADPIEALRQLMHRVGLECADPESAARGCMVANAFNELAAHDDIVAERLRAMGAETQGLIARALRRGQAQGTFDSNRDPDAVAISIFCNLQGLRNFGKSHPTHDVMNAVVVEMLRVLD